MHHHSSPPTRRRAFGASGLRILAGLLAIGFWAGAAGAQTLADAARREAARRKAVPTEAKTYTNRDLGPNAFRPPTPVPEAAPGTSSPAPASEEPAQEVKDEKYWRERIALARENLARAEVLRAALQNRIDSLQTDFVNRDDPAQRAVIAQDRQNALDEMARMTSDIDRLKKEITGIQEEARKAGVPAGWVR